MPDLVLDYHQLFIGPTIKAIPWESAWLSREHLLFDEQTMEVRALYRSFGLQAPLLGIEPDDHLGLELAFMMHLFVESLALYGAGEEEALMKVREVQREFYTKHIMAWVPDCLQQVTREAQSDYYKGAAELCLGCLELTGNVLDEIAPTSFAQVDG